LEFRPDCPACRSWQASHRAVIGPNP
jgi:hypothetical protein